jgi:hypothetical protein
MFAPNGDGTPLGSLLPSFIGVGFPIMVFQGLRCIRSGQISGDRRALLSHMFNKPVGWN